MTQTEYDQSDVRAALLAATELFKFEGQMLAECPFTGQLGFLNVLAFPTTDGSPFAGQFVYVSDDGVNELRAAEVQLHDCDRSFKDVYAGGAE